MAYCLFLLFLSEFSHFPQVFAVVLFQKEQNLDIKAKFECNYRKSANSSCYHLRMEVKGTDEVSYKQ